jgi:predicted ABC-type ATPase
MRMFAGPNGSGKSVLKSYLPTSLLGTYLNPDEIEADVKLQGYLDMKMFGAEMTAEKVLPAFTGSDFLIRQQLSAKAASLSFVEGRLHFPAGVMNSYFASVAADFLRKQLLNRKATFTFETVMSHPGKVEVLKNAREAGYRTYLYYVATDDPEINISRVANRVGLGGHAVPENKIGERYYKSLGLLMEAIRNTNRAYIFDNSTDNADSH